METFRVKSKNLRGNLMRSSNIAPLTNSPFLCNRRTITALLCDVRTPRRSLLPVGHAVRGDLAGLAKRRPHRVYGTSAQAWSLNECVPRVVRLDASSLAANRCSTVTPLPVHSRIRFDFALTACSTSRAHAFCHLPGERPDGTGAARQAIVERIVSRG